MNIWILCTIIEEDYDYSPLITSLSEFTDKIILARFVETPIAYPGTIDLNVPVFKNTTAWNLGFAMAKAAGATHVVVMNSPKSITVTDITVFVEANPDAPVINISDGGAFILNTSSDFVANEDYNFWVEDSNIIRDAIVARTETTVYEEVRVVTRKEEYDLATAQDIANL